MADQNWDLSIINDQVGKDAEYPFPAVTVKTTITTELKVDEVLLRIKRKLMAKYGELTSPYTEKTMTREQYVVYLQPIIDAMALRYTRLFSILCSADGMECNNEAMPSVSASLHFEHAGEVPSKVFDMEAMGNQVRRQAIAIVDAMIDKPSGFADPTSELFIRPYRT